MTNKLLIVNADDFGSCEAVNSGIIDASQSGLVRSASLMINMPAVDEAVQLAMNMPELEVGLHCNLTSGYCLSPASEVDQLAGEDGKFLFDEQNVPDSLGRLRGEAERNETLAAQISLELRLQLERFERTGLRLSHIDSHHYLSLLHPRIFLAHLQAAEAAGVPLRGLCHPMLELLATPAAQLRQLGEYIAGSRVPLPDLSISNLWDGSAPERRTDKEYLWQMESLLAELASRSEVRTVEMIVHPARLSPETHGEDDYAWARRVETALVTNAKFRETIVGLGYLVGGHKDLS